MLEDSALSGTHSDEVDVEQLFATYDTVLQSIANQLAPPHTICRKPNRLAPWFDADCRAQKRECRRLERRYRRTRTDADRRAWVDATRHRFRLHRRKKEEYWLGRLESCGRSSAKVWRMASTLTGRKRDVTSATGHTAEGFSTFFARKIERVRSDTAGLPPPAVVERAASAFTSFRPCSENEVRKIIMSAPIKSCSLDPVPTFLLREFIDVLLPFITRMVNASLQQSRLPDSQKHAIVTPLLKKPGLDTADMNNYRPVSNLSFMSKLIERAVVNQLHEYLTAYNLLPRLQSAYKKGHSTETALLRIWSDMLMAADGKKVTLLGLLDMSAAFDCVDHSILLDRLRAVFGIEGAALEWIRSFLTGRTQQIAYNDERSTTSSVLYGVPQGSVLGPLLYVLYTAPLFNIIAQHRVDVHQYADDIQLYLTVSLSMPPNEEEDEAAAAAAAERLSACIIDVEAWLKGSRLRLNPDKTQFMWLGSAQQRAKVEHVEIPLLSARFHGVDTARNLGVVFDGQLSMSEQVASVCKSGYYQLRQLRPLTKCMSEYSIQTLIHAFITSRLDYCNALYCGISDGLMTRLQSVQNAAARLVTGTGRREHITPVLRQLHWLPVRRRVQYKLATLVYRCLTGTAPAYLTEECRLTTNVVSRSLRSGDCRTCAVRRSHNKFGDRCFAAAGPSIWNSLPLELKQPDLNYDRFRRLLKTNLFV